MSVKSMVAYDMKGCKKPEDAFLIHRIRNGKYKGGIYFYIAICKKGYFEGKKMSIVLKLTFDKEGNFKESLFYNSNIALKQHLLFHNNDSIHKSELYRGMSFLINYANDLYDSYGIEFKYNISGFLSAMMFVFTKHAEIDFYVLLKKYSRGCSPKNDLFKNELFKKIKIKNQTKK